MGTELVKSDRKVKGEGWVPPPTEKMTVPSHYAGVRVIFCSVARASGRHRMLKSDEFAPLLRLD